MDLRQRLDSLIKKDKADIPKYMQDVIKSDFYYLIGSYFEVDFDAIQVEILPNDTQFEINISCLGDRIKMPKILPNV